MIVIGKDVELMNDQQVWGQGSREIDSYNPRNRLVVEVVEEQPPILRLAYDGDRWSRMRNGDHSIYPPSLISESDCLSMIPAKPEVHPIPFRLRLSTKKKGR